MRRMNKDVAITDRGAQALSERAVAAEQLNSGAPGRRHDAAAVLDFATLMRILRDWKWLILGAAALGLAAGIMVTFLTTPLYRAGVTLEVNPPVVEVSEEQTRQRAQTVGSWDFIATQIGLLRSRSLAERVAQDLNLASDRALVGDGPVADRLARGTNLVAGGLTVEAPEEGQLVKFSYVSADAQLAARVANGVAESFINSNLQRRFEASAYARRFLEQQIARTRADLERSEQQLADYARSQGIITLSGGTGGEGGAENTTSLQGESLSALNGALATATARRVAAEGAYRAAQASGPTSEVTSSTQALRQARAGVEAEYQDKLTLLKPDHPDMRALQSRIAEIDRQISRETAQVSGGRNNTLAQEYRSALSAERSLQARVSQLRGSVLDLRGRSVRYNILQRELDTNRGLYDALLGRYKEIGVAGGIGSAPVSIVDRAEVPGGPYTPSLPRNLLGGLGIGLLGGVGLAIGLEFLNDTIKTREDVRNKLGVACLGAVPKRSGKGSFVEDLRSPASAVSEAYSAIAAALRFTTEEGTPRVVLITSSQPAEGKSTTALALSQNLARRGHSVLLVDADLRKPSFKTDTDDVGVTKLLTNHEEVRSHVVPTQYDRLWLLPCGPLPPSPADLLSTGRMGAILTEAAQQFDHVVIDAPPVLGLADAPLLASVSSNLLFVVESGRTRTRGAAEALNRLEASGAHILGAVLTKSIERQNGENYYSYRYGDLEDRRGDRIVMISHRADA